MVSVSLIIIFCVFIPSLTLAIIYRIYKDYKKYFIYDLGTHIISTESMKYFYELGKKCGGKSMEDVPGEFIRLNHTNKKLVYFSFYNGVKHSTSRKHNKFIKKYYEYLHKNVVDQINININIEI